MRPFNLSVPGSSANLGPGFDAVGIAVSLRMRAYVEPAPSFEIAFDREGEAPSHAGLEGLMRRAMHEVCDELPAVRVRVHNAIPLGKGLGSSAAAIVLAIAVAQRAAGKRLSLRSIALAASRLEGHADNVLAAVFGGTVVAADARRFMRLRCSPALRPLLVIPDVDLDTQSARDLLPHAYERADAVFTAQHAAMLGAALACGDRRCLREAMADRLHQPYRAKRIPGLLDVLAVRDRNLAGIALSGAGPSVIGLVDSRACVQRVAHKLASAFEQSGVRTRVLPLRFEQRGLHAA